MQLNDRPLLEDFFNYDPHPMRGTEEIRFLCPWCGDGKPRDNAHRCCSVNTVTKVYRCWRCRTVGALGYKRRDWLTPEEYRKFMDEKRLRELEANRKRAEAKQRYSENVKRVGDFKGVGKNYLKSRGIPLEFAIANQVRYSSNFYGSAALVFPLRDQLGKIRGMTSRYCAESREVKHRTVGNREGAAYFCKGALDGHMLTICEAPLDALSLTLCGTPAMASCGSGLPDWLAFHCFDRNMSVAFATDDDDKGWGDGMAAEFAHDFVLLGVECYRLRPKGMKDWNNVLTEVGIDKMHWILRQADILEDYEG
jgi:hypothetical protein